MRIALSIMLAVALLRAVGGDILERAISGVVQMNGILARAAAQAGR